MNAFVVVFGIPCAIGAAYAFAVVWADWMRDRRRNERIAAKLHSWRHIKRPQPESYASSSWTGR